MQIKSKYNTFGCWLLGCITTFFTALLVLELIVDFDNQVYLLNPRITYNQIVVDVLLVAVPAIFFLFISATFIKRISVDNIGRTITFKNLLTRQIKIYNFSDFDGFIDTFLNHQHSSYKTIGFIKDKRMVRYIDSCWVSNYDEIRKSLFDMKNLGEYRFGMLGQLKFVLRKPIINLLFADVPQGIPNNE